VEVASRSGLVSSPYGVASSRFCLTDLRTSIRAASRLAASASTRCIAYTDHGIQLRFASLPAGRRSDLWSSGIRQTEPGRVRRTHGFRILRCGLVFADVSPVRLGIAGCPVEPVRVARVSDR
jgi:hypothetical protein